jgi:hypothetical protein
MTCSSVANDALKALTTLVLCLAVTPSCGAADSTLQAREEPADDVGVAPSINTCPTFAFYFVLPQQIRPEEVAALLVQGTDLDSDDQDLTYQWSATSGVFSTPTRQSTEYRCASAAGPQILSVAASDPDGCAGHLDLDVDCAEQ